MCHLKAAAPSRGADRGVASSLAARGSAFTGAAAGRTGRCLRAYFEYRRLSSSYIS